MNDANRQMRTIRVYIGDDDAEATQFRRELLEREANIVVVGSSRDVHEMICEVVEKRPDILLLDLVFWRQSMDGITALERIRKTFPEVKAIVVSIDGEHSRRAQDVGAKGYITKPY